MPEYGTCSFDVNGFIELFFVIILPGFMASILTIALNVYLSVKACQVQKQIEKETRLAGYNSESENLKALKKKQRNIRRNRKPMIMLFVVISGSVFVSLFLIPLHIVRRILVNSQVYQDILDYIFFPNIEFMLQFFYVLVYGLYFKQVCEPMMRHLRRFVRI